MSGSSSIRKQLHLNPYDYHKYLINEYVLKKAGDTKLIYKSDTSKFKNDRDVILENMKFIWNEEEMPCTYEEKLAKKYYDKLFREYCICDLSRYKENKIANRFRIEKEVINGKGQFSCAEKSCNDQTNLRTWEVNFSYVEKNEKKNALVKIRLCEPCSLKLNHHSQKREVKRLKRNKSRSKASTIQSDINESIPKTPSSSRSHRSATRESPLESPPHRQISEPINDESLWKQRNEPEMRGRDVEFDEYLAELLL